MLYTHYLKHQRIHKEDNKRQLCESSMRERGQARHRPGFPGGLALCPLLVTLVNDNVGQTLPSGNCCLWGDLPGNKGLGRGPSDCWRRERFFPELAGIEKDRNVERLSENLDLGGEGRSGLRWEWQVCKCFPNCGLRQEL